MADDTIDIEAIKLLKSRYFRFLDTQDWDSFRCLFTDDFVSDTKPSGGKVIHGADEFVSFVKSTLANCTTVHHGLTPEINITSLNTATGIWAMEDLVRMPGLIDLQGFGHYQEEYKKVNNQWCIHYSKLTRLRMDFRFLCFRIKLPQFLLHYWQAR
ncbi:nuclear transport factor 2 family protein [Ketobacter sp. MCCC 1A13808]|uniref:nuclear transport factor 2 family protein n=1 Tax=Ketobacter sp. MCCC 1A13808 TaxID=2602738 RepID=UPI000F1C42B3|nr:nuclear transport factor 2 family protein [Ketobacter sp. MCCC 1A13808]MVF13589.1 nuclear transport factor 2 family protein [Ketobacter sp. MCCC 1A13808]RLP56474.1 MAG: nuclear transport factor 2 family protein [Ketobacter sp.]